MEKLNPYEFLEFIVDVEKIKSRAFLEGQNISGRLIRKACQDNNIFVNGERTFKNIEVKRGDTLAIKFPDENLNARVQNFDLEIIYEDFDLIIINKPPFMVTHTAKDDREDTLLNYLAGYFEKNKIKRKVRFVNRLDRDTSGLIIVAKNSFAHGNLSKIFQSDNIIKKYLAIVQGKFKIKEGIIEKKIGLSEDGIRRKIDEDKGKYAKTYFKLIDEEDDFSLVELRIFTGRTHQIRVHLSSIGHPILGDGLYNEIKKNDLRIKRLLLHSYYLSFKHPRTGKIIELKTKIPHDFLPFLGAKYWKFKESIV